MPLFDLATPEESAVSEERFTGSPTELINFAEVRSLETEVLLLEFVVLEIFESIESFRK